MSAIRPTEGPVGLLTLEPEEAAVARKERRRLPRKAVVGGCIVGFFVVVAILAPLLAPADPGAQDVSQRLQSPSPEHLLGTDALGRDVLSRIIYGTRVDLPVAVLAVLLPALIGVTLGALAGFFGSWVDTAVMRTADVFQAFPIYIFLIALVFALGPGVRSVLIAFAVIGWVVYARLVRGEILRIKQLEFVQAARIAGIGRLRILVRHVMPNAWKQTVVYMSSDVVLAMITFAALSFFGIGVPTDTPEWGQMIADGQEYLRTEPLLSVAPGIAIVSLGLGFALIGDGLDDYLL